MEKETVFQKLMGFLNKAGTAIMMNLLFLVSCLPVVTIGAAWSGLYGAVRYSIRGDSWFQGFKYGFKCHFWRNLIGWTFGLLVIGYSVFNIYGPVAAVLDKTVALSAVLMQIVIPGLFALAAALVVAVMLPLGMYFPQLDANTWLVTSWDIIFHAPLQCLGVVLLMWLPVIILYAYLKFALLIFVTFVAIYYVLAALISTVLLKKSLLRILQRYPRDEEEA